MSPNRNQSSDSSLEPLLAAVSTLARHLTEHILAITSTGEDSMRTLQSRPLYLSDSVLTVSVEVRLATEADRLDMQRALASASSVDDIASLVATVNKSRIQ